MGLLLVSLIDINLRVSTLLKENNTRQFRWFVWAPLGLYLGWICVATIVNVAVYLTSIGWDQLSTSSDFWAVAMISIGGLIGLGLLSKMRLVPAAISIGWSFFGIIMKQRQLQGFNAVMTISMIMIGLLVVAIGLTYFKRNQSKVTS